MQDQGGLSSRSLLEDQIGPILKMDPSLIKNCQKDKFISRISFESEQCIKMNNEALGQSVNESADHRKTPYSGRRKSTRIPVSKRKLDSTKKMDGFSILKTMQQNQLIQKFAKSLLMKAYILSSHDRAMIEQESYLQSKTDKSKQLNQNQSTSNSLFAPGSQLVMGWDISATFIHLFSLWLCPFVSAFIDDDSWSIAELCIIMHILLDIIIHLNRPIMIQGEILVNKLEIIKHYFHGQLLEDLTSLTLWFLVYFNFNQIPVANEIIALLLTTISILKVKRNYENFIESLYLQGAVNQLIDLITLIMMIYIFAHLMACVFFHVGNITSETTNSWLMHYNILHESVAVKYNHSFYWATMTMVTVGYGDITPQNEIEMVIVNLLMLLSSCMFGYSMNSIGIILKNIQEVKQKCKRSLILMNSYMRQNAVNVSIQSRVREFIKYQNEMESKENSDDIKQIINDLPNQLKSELESDVQMKIMSNIKSISSQFTKQTSRELQSKLIQLKFTPSDIVYHQDQIDDNLYYLKNGEISIIEEKSGKLIQTIKSGSSFNEFSFFTGNAAKTSAVSVGFSEVYQVQRGIFLKIMQSNARDFEKFHCIKDNIILYQNYSMIQQYCNYCKLYSHQNIDCPLLTYQPDVLTKNIKENKKIEQQRRKSCNRKSEKIKSLLIWPQISQEVNEFLEQSSSFNDKIREIQKHSEESSNYQQYLVEIRNEDKPIENNPNTGLFHNPPSTGNQTASSNEQPNQIPPSLALLRGKSSRYVFNPAQKQGYPKNYFFMENKPEATKKLDPLEENGSFIYQLQFIYQLHANNIDQMKEYQNYMPYNNFSNAVKQLERAIEKKPQLSHKNYHKDTIYFSKIATPLSNRMNKGQIQQ